MVWRLGIDRSKAAIGQPPKKSVQLLEIPKPDIVSQTYHHRGDAHLYSRLCYRKQLHFSINLNTINLPSNSLSTSLARIACQTYPWGWFFM